MKTCAITYKYANYSVIDEHQEQQVLPHTQDQATYQEQQVLPHT